MLEHVSPQRTRPGRVVVLGASDSAWLGEIWVPPPMLGVVGASPSPPPTGAGFSVTQ